MSIRVNDLDFTRFAFDADSDWGKCLTSYLNQIYRKSNSPHTLEHYRATLQGFFSSSPLKMPYLKSREDVEQFITTPGRRHGQGYGKPVGPGTSNNKLITLHSFYHYAASYGVQGDDGMLYPLFKYLPPTAGIYYAQRPQAGNKALSDEELRRFFAAIGTEGLRAKRDRALFLALFWCARRVSEITELRWQNISQTMIVDSTGSSRLAWTYTFFGKGKKSIADVSEYPSFAASALFEYLEESGSLATMEPTDAVFTALPDYRGRGGGYDPKRPLIPQQVWRIAHEYGIKAGLNRSVTTHIFRHTSTRIAYANGASIRDLQQKLRHKNLATTSLYVETLVSVSDNTLDRLHQFANL